MFSEKVSRPKGLAKRFTKENGHQKIRDSRLVTLVLYLADPEVVWLQNNKKRYTNRLQSVNIKQDDDTEKIIKLLPYTLPFGSFLIGHGYFTGTKSMSPLTFLLLFPSHSHSCS